MFIAQEYEPAVTLDRVHEHPDNPRRGDEDAIEASIDAHGFYGAVVAQRSTGYVLAGNHRRRIVARRGEPTIPVLWIDVDDEEALRILLNDNTSSDGSSYHDDSLTGLLERLSQTSTGLAGTGFGANDLERLRAQLAPTPGGLDDVPKLDEGTEHSCPYCKAQWRDTSGGLVRLDG